MKGQKSQTRCIRGALIVTLTGLPCLFTGGSARGEIAATTGRVQTTVQELLDDTPASVNSDSRELPADTDDFPLVASAFLDTTDLNGARTAIGQGFGILEDPARTDQPNPQEFALEAACFSNVQRVSYLVESVATETRTVVFDRNDLELGPFDDTQDVTSRAFLSGAVIFWSHLPITPARPLSADIRFSIMRGDGEPLFSTQLAIQADRDTVATGPIRFEEVGVDELADLGVDAATLAILRQLEEDGELVIVVVPPQEHEYGYTATVDEPFDLTATLEVEIRNSTQGTGVAAVMGRPFEELADFIEDALPDADGEAVQRSVNQAAARRALGLVSNTVPTPSGPRLCGAMGGTALVMLPLLGLTRRGVPFVLSLKG